MAKTKQTATLHSRRSIRLPGYDYSRHGLYFITICLQGKACLLGSCDNEQVMLNDAGKMIEYQWAALPERYLGLELHDFIVMPNHFHGIIQFVDHHDTTAAKISVGDVVGAFKSLTTNDYIPNVKQNNWPHFYKKMWQRNYYEHVIRDKESYENISEYIKTNPMKWRDDKYFVPAP